MSVPESRKDVSEDAPARDDAHASRPLTFAQNLVATLKVLVGFGLLVAVLWAAELWTAAR